MIKTDRGYFGPAELAAPENPAVPGEHVVVRIDQDGDVKTKFLDAGGDFSDLFFAVMSRVGGVEFQLVDRPLNNL